MLVLMMMSLEMCVYLYCMCVPLFGRATGDWTPAPLQRLRKLKCFHVGTIGTQEALVFPLSRENHRLLGTTFTDWFHATEIFSAAGPALRGFVGEGKPRR
jgi:hypothetical protein